MPGAPPPFGQPPVPPGAPPGAGLTECGDWKAGKCARGASCKYAHIGPSPRPAGWKPQEGAACAPVMVVHHAVGPPAGWVPEECRRPGPHGNPFEMRGNPAMRDPVCRAHREAPRAAMRGEVPDLGALAQRHGCAAPRLGWDGAAAAVQVRELRGRLRQPGARPLALACTCAPEECHCDSIRGELLA